MTPTDITASGTPDTEFPDVAASVPDYLVETYWWAYVHPWAVRFFEREWLVNLILLGNYARLRDAALEEIAAIQPERAAQLGCVYGDLSLRVSETLPDHGMLDVVDVLPIQLRNLQAKLPPRARVRLCLRNSAALQCPDAHYDAVLLFFLLHEQPEAVRRRTLSEALRVVRPGGSIVVVDYHRPESRMPLAGAMRRMLARLEPFALDLWRDELPDYLPPDAPLSSVRKQTYFGGLYQKLVLTRETTTARARETPNTRARDSA
ncbi:MAG: methyltransferase domain-containing protein [Betaproteobacteria bacterium]|nr:methyltransferase domain-containing protein [Betaproteobacteria bacterium]